METNYFGPLLLSRAFAPILKQNGGGAIVNVLSFLSWVSIPDAGTYCASKVRSLGINKLAAHRLARTRDASHWRAPRTEMVSHLTLPKVKPVNVVRQALSAIESGCDEVLANEIARQVKAGLSKEPGIYLNFDPQHYLATGA